MGSRGRGVAWYLVGVQRRVKLVVGDDAVAVEIGHVGDHVREDLQKPPQEEER